MVERVGSIAAVESLNQVGDAVVVVIQIVEVVDAVVVVVFGVGLLKEEAVSWVEGKC